MVVIIIRQSGFSNCSCKTLVEVLLLAAPFELPIFLNCLVIQVFVSTTKAPLSIKGSFVISCAVLKR